MTKLIGQITYPQEAAFSVEYVKLYNENESSLLEFRLVNNGKKTVNAYRIDLSYSHNGEEKSQAIQGKNLELVSQSKTDVITVSLPAVIEEGALTLSAVIYDDLTHGTDAPAYPFASFDIISRVAERTLAGSTPVTKPAVVTPVKEAPKANVTPAPTTPKTEVSEEPGGKKSHLPLILALSSLGGIIFTFFLRIISAYILKGVLTDGLQINLSFGAVYTSVSLFSLLLQIACATLALTAILIHKKNPAQSAAVIVFSSLTLLLYLFWTASLSAMLFVVATLLLAIIFLIIALVKKNTALLVTTLSMALLVFAIIGAFGGCNKSPSDTAKDELPASTTAIGVDNNRPTRLTDHYMVLEFSPYDPGECLVSGCSFITYASNDSSMPEDHYIPIIDGRIDLTIPEYSPDGRRVVGIGSHALQDASALRSVTLPSSVVTIFDHAFYYCANLTEIDLNSVQIIENSAFHGCEKLEIVRGLENLVEIHNGVFTYCHSLTDVSLGNNLKVIGEFAFHETGIRSITVPASVTTLGGAAFQSCRSLTNVTIDANLSRLSTDTFANCTSLVSVKIPASVERFNSGVFKNCYALSQIIYGGSPEAWESISIDSENDALQNVTIDYLYQ